MAEKATKTTEVTSETAHTYHGRTYKPNGQLNENRDIYRTRSHSIRRMDRASLQTLADQAKGTSAYTDGGEPSKPNEGFRKTHTRDPDQFMFHAAKNELETRLAMEQASDLQKRGIHDPTVQQQRRPNRWEQGMSAQGVDALRYGSSLAEQAGEQLIKEGELKSRDDLPKQLGYSEVNGVGGLGFSGGEEKDATNAQKVMDRMVKLNKEQQELSPQDHSTVFREVHVPEVIPNIDPIEKKQGEFRERVCAVHRATATAIFGATDSSQVPSRVKASDLPTDTAAMEVRNNAFGGKAGLKAHQTSEHFTHDPVQGIQFQQLKRTKSSEHLMDSCKGCSTERINTGAGLK